MSGGLASAALGGFLLWPHGNSPAPVAAPDTSATTAVVARVLTDKDAKALSSALASGQVEQVRRAVLVPAGQPLAAELPAQRQSLGTLTFDPATFVPGPDKTATVAATSTPPGGTSARWTVHLVHEDTAGWLVATTERR